MTFHSLPFAVFFPVVLLIYWRLPHRWQFFRETNPVFLFRYLHLSPFDTTPQEREIAIYMLMTTLPWVLPLWLDDAVALFRERTPYSRPVSGWGPLARAATEVTAVGALFTMILALRSRISFDFIYFQF